MVTKLYQRVLIILLIGLLHVSRASATQSFKSLYDSAKRYESMEMAYKVLELAIEIETDSLLAKSHFLLAYYQDEQLMYYEALNNYFSALNHYKNSHNAFRQIGCLKNIGLIYVKGGFYEKALTFYNEARHIAISNGNSDAILSLDYQTAKAMVDLGEFESAKEMFQELLIANQHTENDIRNSNIYQELGFIAVKQNDFDLARTYYTRSVNALLVEDKYKQLAILRKKNSFAHMYIQDSDYLEAKSVLLESLTISKNTEFESDVLIDIYTNLGDSYVHLDDLDSAASMYGKRMQYDEVRSFNKGYLATANYLYDYYSQLGNSLKADYYHKITFDFGNQLSDFKEALLNNFNRYQIAAADAKREVEIARQEKREERITYLMICSILFISLMAMLGYFVYRNSQRTKLARELLKSTSTNI